ncbi:3007_t:CDS:2 [Ambispora gerdemannii]|uniref:3007_t:CDS:1 n=1 Tax=Ambispora gerdemannii TaxID=144530 RepID=A0A9N8ZBG2_9GLOM|nr:3007_t:CDS:2 [Ambispora gerdemannii]
MEKWFKENLLRILDTVIQRDACLKLREHCLNTLCPDPYRYFDSEDFINLEESTLIMLVSRDDLNMDEAQLWEYLIRWGVANTPNLQNDVGAWSQRDFWGLKKTLHKCVPLIRFWQLSVGDYNEKVKPFEKILTKNLNLKLFHHFSKTPVPSLPEPPTTITLPSPPPNFIVPERAIDSIIITHQQAALVSRWIDRKFVSTKTSLSRIKADCTEDAIQLHEGLGPSFGFYEFKILDEANECKSSYGTGGLRYQNKIREKCNYFGVDDYEVFQVVKKEQEEL